MDKINKLTLPSTILLASIILGGFYYASQVSKQASVERQQQVVLKAQAVADQAKGIADQVAKCTQMGVKKSKDEQDTVNIVYLKSEYQYDPNLGTCLYKGGYISSIKTEYIIDLYTNKELISYTIPILEKLTSDDQRSLGAFQQKSAELFKD